MEKRGQFTNWAIELQSLAQDGLEYGHDRFDLERYTRIREIATEMMSAKTGLPIKQVKELFSSDDGYQTPKLAVRAAIFNDEKILLVKETTDEHWSMPGGWCDPNLTTTENCIKEVKEEAGREVKIEKVIALIDKSVNVHNQKRVERAINCCSVFFLCKELGGKFVVNTETTEYDYFDVDHLPPLSVNRTTADEVKMCLKAALDPHWQVICD